jgi:hypothetical protein
MRDKAKYRATTVKEPLIIRCQCQHHCNSWVRLEDRDADTVGDRHLAAIHPSHGQPTDLVWDIRPGYLIVQRPPSAEHRRRMIPS